MVSVLLWCRHCKIRKLTAAPIPQAPLAGICALRERCNDSTAPLSYYYFVLDVSKQLDATSLEAAREIITRETIGSKRVTKKALLESIGYGVSAAQTSQKNKTTLIRGRLYGQAQNSG